MRILFKAIGVALILVFLVLSIQSFEAASFLEELRLLGKAPYTLMMITVMYGAAFLLRAYAWKLYLHGRITIREGLCGLLYSLLVNHLSPLKVGDAVRMAVVTKEKRVTFSEAAQSVVVLRLLDLLVLGLFSGIGMVVLLGTITLSVSFLAAAVVGVGLMAMVLYKKAPRFLQKQRKQFQEAIRGWRGFIIVSLVAASWICEAFVIYGICSSLPFWKSVWVNSVTIAGQVFQLTPGGIGTYETVMTFALSTVGIPMQEAYELALLSHVFKFAFSYVAGAIVFIVHPIHIRSFLRNRERGEIEWRK